MQQQPETVKDELRVFLGQHPSFQEIAGRLHRRSGSAEHLSNPFKRFEDMQMLHHTKTLGLIQMDESVWKKLTREEKQAIERICDEKLESYFQRLK